MNRNRLLFIQNQILPPSTHHKWKEVVDIVCKTIMEHHRDQLLMEIPTELKDDSIGYCRSSLKIQLMHCAGPANRWHGGVFK